MTKQLRKKTKINQSVAKKKNNDNSGPSVGQAKATKHKN
jgi:hypothetical protein